MPEEDRELDALRDAIDAFAADRAPDLAAEAAAEAMAKVRSMLADAIARSLLDRSAQSLASKAREGGPAVPPPNRRPARAAGGVAAEKPTSSPAREASADAELGYYVYGVVAPGADLATDRPGIDPAHSVELIADGGLAALASRVSLAEFGEEPLRENLNDIVWLEEKARAHERVLDEALERTTVVPLRLCTIYRSAGQVREALRGERARFADALGRLEGNAEWGVKLIAEPGALQRAAAPGGPVAHDAPSDGVAYLNRKRDQARARDEADRIAEHWMDAAHERLARHASEARLNPIQNPEVSGHEGEMLLNGVYLVADRKAEEFRRAVEQLEGEYEDLGVAVELTGPWPAYNFVEGSIEAAK